MSATPEHPDQTVDADTTTTGSAASFPAQNVGPYRLLQRLGEGGMGEVWLAEQVHPLRRQVAIKLIKAGMDTAQVIARFDTERQALAMMDHPAIAKVFDAGSTPEGRPYFAMEYVRGEPISTYCDRHRLPVRERLELFIQLCDGVQHAHQKGVIHRDLKPSNVLVSVQDDRPVPCIIDFGVAKAVSQPLTVRSMFTEFGALIGTPEYMSPEQAEMTSLDVDTRSDVYSLGVVLYELLVGALPFDSEALRKAGLDAIRKTIREQDPPRPSVRLTKLAATVSAAAEHRRTDAPKLARQLRGDLDWITLKALDKDRTRRYQTANALAADVRRHLNDEPVSAGPPGGAYRIGKFVRRHRVAVGTASAFAALLIVGIVFSSWMAVRARRAERRADAESAAAKAVNDFLQTDLLAQASASTQANPNTKPDPDLKVRTALDRAAARIEGKFASQPVIEASIRQTIGTTYKDLGLYPEAQRQTERALELRRRVLGETNLDTLASLNVLALVHIYQGRRAEAEALYTKVVQIQHRLLGAEHSNTLHSMSQLATVYRDEGKYAEAEALYRKALEIERRVLGEQHPNTLDSMDELAALSWMRGQHAEAEALYTKVFDLRRRVLGEEHPDTLKTMTGLGVLYRGQGKHSQAEALYTKVLEVQRRVQGEEHSDTLTSMNNLGVLYRSQGKYAQAEPLLIRALEGRQRVLGAEHPATLNSMNSLGRLYQAQGKYDQAEALFTKVVDIRHRLLGEDHPDTLMAMNDLGVLYRGQGKYAQAARLLLKTRDIRQRVLGNEHPDTLNTLFSLGRVRLLEQKYGEAETTLRAVLKVYEKAATDTWERYDCQSMLGASLAGQRKYDEAEPLLVAGYEGMTQRQTAIPAESSLDVEQAGTRIVRLYHDWGRSEKAAEWEAKLHARAVAPQRE